MSHKVIGALKKHIRKLTNALTIILVILGVYILYLVIIQNNMNLANIVSVISSYLSMVGLFYAFLKIDKVFAENDFISKETFLFFDQTMLARKVLKAFDPLFLSLKYLKNRNLEESTKKLQEIIEADILNSILNDIRSQKITNIKIDNLSSNSNILSIQVEHLRGVMYQEKNYENFDLEVVEKELNGIAEDLLKINRSLSILK